jgi:uncharacterized protein YcsI (UPF0317 family)
VTGNETTDRASSVLLPKISNSDFVEVGKGNNDACPILAEDTVFTFKVEEHFT